MGVFKFSSKKIIHKRMSRKLARIVTKLKREMQFEENFRKGKRARTVSFLDATHELAVRLENARK